MIGNNSSEESRCLTLNFGFLITIPPHCGIKNALVGDKVESEREMCKGLLDFEGMYKTKCIGGNDDTAEAN